MRELKLTSKATWALQLLGGEAFDQDVVKKIGQISDERNAYTHYKWNDGREYSVRQQALTNIFAAAASVVSAINVYENKALFAGKRSRIKKMLSGKKNNLIG